MNIIISHILFVIAFFFLKDHSRVDWLLQFYMGFNLFWFVQVFVTVLLVGRFKIVYTSLGNQEGTDLCRNLLDNFNDKRHTRIDLFNSIYAVMFTVVTWIYFPQTLMFINALILILGNFLHYWSYQMLLSAWENVNE